MSERYDRFLDIVELKASLPRRDAERHAEAVFDALARTVGEDEVADMVSELPQDFLPLVAEAERRFSHVPSADECVRRIAEREGVAPAEAREHARAVFATLREAVGEKEFLDVSAQLPFEYAALAARPW